MATPTNQFRPDYAVPPGWVLEERLEVQGISHAEFARRCGRSPKLISEIIAGKASLEPETALQFEKVLGVDARIWLGVEADYQLHRARETEAAGAADSGAWLKAFPIQELVRRGIIRRSADLEAEADEWASNMFVSRNQWEQFVATSPRSERAVRAFADEQGIAPGIVVGMLQHGGYLPWTHLNGLKVRLEWKAGQTA